MSPSPQPAKHERMEAWMTGFREGGDSTEGAADYVRAYVQCFNAGEYYEAHDALEHYWLTLPRDTPEWTCCKGLIQLAGAFVHLRLHFLYPEHRVHGRRLGPAAKLFKLARQNIHSTTQILTQYRLDLLSIELFIRVYQPREARNVWTPAKQPQLELFPLASGPSVH